MNDIRISGTLEELQQWEKILKELQENDVIEIMEVSKPYKNRGDNKIYRQYLKAKIIK